MERGSVKILPLLLMLAVLIGILVVMWQFPSLFPHGSEPSQSDDPPVEPQPDDDPAVLPADPIVSLTGDRYTYTDLQADLEALAGQYPEAFTYRSFGTSADGRSLYVATLGDPNADKQIIVTAGMHAREYVNCYVIMRQMEHYLANYDTGTYQGVTYRTLFDEVALIVVPMCNPDGITIAQEGIRAVRSSHLRSLVRDIYERENGQGGLSIDDFLNKYWKANARGVDINRNFDALWSQHNDRVNQVASSNYKGAMAASEPETAALVRLSQELSGPVASICVHHQGEWLYWRCEQPGTFSQTGALLQDNQRLVYLAKDITDYYVDPEDQTEPSYSNWTILAMGIPTITVETGISTYPLSYGLADGIFEKTLPLWPATALAYLSIP